MLRHVIESMRFTMKMVLGKLEIGLNVIAYGNTLAMA